MFSEPHIVPKECPGKWKDFGREECIRIPSRLDKELMEDADVACKLYHSKAKLFEVINMEQVELILSYSNIFKTYIHKLDLKLTIIILQTNLEIGGWDLLILEDHLRIIHHIQIQEKKLHSRTSRQVSQLLTLQEIAST